MKFDILTGDVVEVLPTLEPNSFDAALCDPPYALTDLVSRRLPGRKGRKNRGGFMNQPWDAELPGVECWTELLRVLKPGAMLLAFGGTRTHHRLMCALEDAGFEIRDCMVWLFGSGFPKSRDISKDLDRAAGAEREVGQERTHSCDAYPGRIHPTSLCSGRPSKRAGQVPNGTLAMHLATIPATDLAKRWSGYGTALKPAAEMIVIAMKPLDGTFAHNAQKWGVAGINVDGSRIATADQWSYPNGPGGCKSSEFHYAKRAETPAESSPLGRWPANVLLSHTPDCREVGTRKVRTSRDSLGRNATLNESGAWSGIRSKPEAGHLYGGPDGTETIAAWDCAPDCAARQLDEMSGELHGSGNTSRVGFPGGLTFGGGEMRANEGRWFGDSGGASRFFYTAKVSTAEREGSDHPTMKPIDLTRYLAKLILPPQRETPRRILVPFAGVGSEMIGAILAGWDEVVGIEKDEGYAAKARERIVGTAPLFLEEAAL